MPKVYILTAFYDKTKEFETEEEAYEWIWTYAVRQYEALMDEEFFPKDVPKTEEELQTRLLKSFPTYTTGMQKGPTWTYRMI